MRTMLTIMKKRKMVTTIKIKTYWEKQIYKCWAQICLMPTRGRSCPMKDSRSSSKTPQKKISWSKRTLLSPETERGWDSILALPIKAAKDILTWITYNNRMNLSLVLLIQTYLINSKNHWSTKIFQSSKSSHWWETKTWTKCSYQRFPLLNQQWLKKTQSE